MIVLSTSDTARCSTGTHGMGDNASYTAMLAMASKPGVKRLSTARFEWDISNRCESPVRFGLTGRPEQITARTPDQLPPDVQKRIPADMEWIELHNAHWYYDKGYSYPLMVDLEVPCRKCSVCLRRRAMLWAHKAKAEIQSASRTWSASDNHRNCSSGLPVNAFKPAQFELRI